MNVRTRYAPSPTGFTHVGGARTALFSYLFARKHGGQFILRIEDTDQEREVEGAVGHLLEALRWLGITWDEGPDNGGPHDPYYQSARLPLYKKYADQLIAAGFAYPDPYTEEEVQAFRSKAEEEKRLFLYRDHRPETIDEWDGKRPLRFRIPEVKRYTWTDLVRGELSAGEEALDDFILIKTDGYPTYNFAHIVDDIEMGITHVVRGEEFISSTPKFLALYEALDIAPPAFATMPVILGPDGNKKLSKRDGAKDILDYRAEGYLPEAMRNFLALIGWNPGTEQELFTDEELIAAFDFDRVQKGGGAFDEQKLLFINREWMRKLSDDEYVTRGELSAPDMNRLKAALPLLRERASTFSEARAMLTEELACLFTTPTLALDLLIAKGPAESTKTHLSHLQASIEELSEGATIASIKETLMPYADSIPKEEGGRGAALWPLRYALSGEEKSPDPFTLIHILGNAEASSRVRNALAIL
ncbi:MAG: gltX [Parcubacteria group bacterium]|nr:gltX [Parcubacteria group bacterium]